MTTFLSLDQITTGLITAEFGSGGSTWQVVTMGAIVMAESRGGIDITHYNDTDTTSVAYRSTDWGVGQINDYWAPKVLSRGLMTKYWSGEASMSQLGTDAAWNFAAMREMFLLRVLDYGSWSQGYTVWNAYTNGSYKQFLSESRLAARRAGLNV